MMEWFGSQDSNFHWQLVTEDLAGRSAKRCWDRRGCMLSAMYTDVFFVFDPRTLVAAEMVRFAVDAASVVGKDAINAKKTVSGAHQH